MKFPWKSILCCLTVALIGSLGWSVKVQASDRTKISAEADQFAQSQPAPLQPLFKSLYIEGEHNAVLNFDYLGLAALESGQYDIAEKAFDAAILRINAIYANNPNAEKAKSLFAKERVKDFKGEPYERAMTFYYRGILYLRNGDYQNARASFLSAEWQTTLSENESYQSTFGLMDFLAAWSSYCDGDMARGSELQKRASAVQSEVFSKIEPESTYLGLIELGMGPVKTGTGKYKEKLSFAKSAAVPVLESATPTSVAQVGLPVTAADLNWQAMTRGGRPVDSILNGKAQWKQGAETTGETLAVVGYAAGLQGARTGNEGLEKAGSIGMLAGLASGIFASAVTPAADTRAWSALPAVIALQTGKVDGTATPGADFKSNEMATPMPASMASRNGKCALTWGRSRSALESARQQMQTPIPDESKRTAVNAEFRGSLMSTFGPATPAQEAVNHVGGQP